MFPSFPIHPCEYNPLSSSNQPNFGSFLPWLPSISYSPHNLPLIFNIQFYFYSCLLFFNSLILTIFSVVVSYYIFNIGSQYFNFRLIYFHLEIQLALQFQLLSIVLSIHAPSISIFPVPASQCIDKALRLRPRTRLFPLQAIYIRLKTLFVAPFRAGAENEVIFWIPAKLLLPDPNLCPPFRRGMQEPSLCFQAIVAFIFFNLV